MKFRIMAMSQLKILQVTQFGQMLPGEMLLKIMRSAFIMEILISTIMFLPEALKFGYHLMTTIGILNTKIFHPVNILHIHGT